MSREAARALDDYSRALRGLEPRNVVRAKATVGCFMLLLVVAFLVLCIAALIKVVFL